MKPFVFIGSFILVAIGVLMLHACTKDETQGSEFSAVSTNAQRMSPELVYEDSMVFVSRIHSKRNPVCAKGDSVSEIKIFRNRDGSVDYKHSTRIANTDDKFISYTPDVPFRQVNDNLILVELPPGETFFKIPFDNPAAARKIGGTIRFTCECCSGNGSCHIAGECCPFKFWCAGPCVGECGLNASESSARHKEFVIVRANRVRLKR